MKIKRKTKVKKKFILFPKTCGRCNSIIFFEKIYITIAPIHRHLIHYKTYTCKDCFFKEC